MKRQNLHLIPLLSRRQAVVGFSAAGLGAAGLGTALLPACGEPDGNVPAEEVPPGTIDHVIVIMMENRSFDHYLGSLKLLEGVALDGLDADMFNEDYDGTPHYVAPAAVDCVEDPPHGWDPSHSAFDEGANDGFVRAYLDRGASLPAEVMGYMTRDDLPLTYSLSDQFLTCDRYFCSVMGPTWPNRMYGHAGTSDGQEDNSWPTSGGFTFPTVWTQLDAIGVPWKYYFTDLPFIGLFSDHLKEGFNGALDVFFADCAAGTLPAVCWIDPGFTSNDDHPPHPVGRGQELLASIFDALGKSPLWEKCLVLLTYDENGGFFDHVAPPTTEDDFSDLGFDQMGFRVPSQVVGPFVKQGVSSELLDHTSWLKLICEKHGIEPWTKRIAAATSLAVCIDEDRLSRNEPLPPPVIPTFVHDEELLGEECDGQGVFGPTGAPSTETLLESGQPELQAWLSTFLPGVDRLADTQQTLAMIRDRLR